MRNISGQRFGRLVAIRPTEQRRSGSVVWECACDCGSTAFTSSNGLCCGKTRSCGCLRRDTAAQSHKFDPAANDRRQAADAGEMHQKNNMTGRRGIGYRSKMGKYIARVGFQLQSYYLGAYQSIEDAIDVRKKAEALIWEKGDGFYEGWKEQAEADPAWAREHPIRICVIKNEEERGYSVSFSPEL